MNSVQHVVLDILNNKVYQYIYTKQYDIGRQVEISVTEDEKPFDLSGVDCVFEMKKSDGSYSFHPVSVIQNKVTFTIDKYMTALAGKFPYQLSFLQNDDIISTVTGYILVEPSVVQIGDIESTSDDNIFDGYDPYSNVNDVKVDGVSVVDNNKVANIEVFTGSTAGSDGTAGVVPTPPRGNIKFLSSRGTWEDANTTIEINQIIESGIEIARVTIGEDTTSLYVPQGISVHYGDVTPNSNLGNDGDIYFKLRQVVLDVDCAGSSIWGNDGVTHNSNGYTMTMTGTGVSDYEYVSYSLHNLTIGKEYTLSFDATISPEATFYNNAYSFGIHFENIPTPSYRSTLEGGAWDANNKYISFYRDLDTHRYTVTFVATASTMYATVLFGDIVDGVENTLTISNFDVAAQMYKGISVIYSKHNGYWEEYMMPVFKGATSISDGDKGLVPSPGILDASKFLRGDGTWAEIDTSDAQHVDITQAEYDALTEEEKLNGTEYFITDGTPSSEIHTLVAGNNITITDSAVQGKRVINAIGAVADVILDGLSTLDPSTHIATIDLSNYATQDYVSLQLLSKQDLLSGSAHISIDNNVVSTDCSVVTANPQDSATDTLTKLNIDGTVYNIQGSGGTAVEANPSGSPTDTLNTISINGVIYDIDGSGGGGGNSITYGYVVPTTPGNDGDIYYFLNEITNRKSAQFLYMTNQWVLIEGSPYQVFWIYNEGTEEVSMEVFGGSKNADNISLNVGAGNYTNYAITSSAVDVTNYTSLRVSCRYRGYDYNSSFDITGYTGNKYISFVYLTDNSHNEAAIGILDTKTPATTFRIDSRDGNVAEEKLYKLWLE